MKISIEILNAAKDFRERPARRKREVVDRLSGKTSKQQVNYRPASSDVKSSCSECEHYQFPGQDTSNCRRVAGVVEAEDICDIFVARMAENQDTDQGESTVRLP